VPGTDSDGPARLVKRFCVLGAHLGEALSFALPCDVVEGIDGSESQTAGREIARVGDPEVTRDQ